MFQPRFAFQAALRTFYRIFKKYIRREDYFVTKHVFGKWLSPRLKHFERRLLWLEVFSGGEATQVVSFCRELKVHDPRMLILVTTNNRYAADFTREHNPHVDLVWDSPWDIDWVVRWFIRRIKPSAVGFVENCSLPRLAAVAQASQIPTLLISGLVNENFKEHPIYLRPFRMHFENFIDFFTLKSEDDTLYLKKQGIPSYRMWVTGNLKYDAALIRLPENEREVFRKNWGLCSDFRYLVGGSLHSREPGIVADLFLKLRKRSPKWRWVLVPRYNELLPEIYEVLKSRGLKYELASERKPGSDWAHDILVVDRFGLLTRFYNLSDLTVLGGSFYQRSTAGFSQNLVEPVLSGSPTFFGPMTSQFQDLALQLEGAEPRFRSTISTLVENVEAYLEAGGGRETFKSQVAELERRTSEIVSSTAQRIMGIIPSEEKNRSEGVLKTVMHTLSKPLSSI